MSMNQETEAASAPAKRPIIRPRTWSKFALPSERFSFETHFEILRQFVVRTKQDCAELLRRGARVRLAGVRRSLLSRGRPNRG